MCFVHTKVKSRRFQISLFEERFRKAPFSWRISVDDRPNRTYKSAISNFAGIACGLGSISAALSSGLRPYPRRNFGGGARAPFPNSGWWLSLRVDILLSFVSVKEISAIFYWPVTQDQCIPEKVGPWDIYQSLYPVKMREISSQEWNFSQSCSTKWTLSPKDTTQFRRSEFEQ